MQKQTAKHIPRWGWYLLAVLPALIAAPNGLVVKMIDGEIDPAWINALRFLIASIVLLPFVLRASRRMTRQNVRYAVLQGVAYATAVTSFVFSVSLGQASYTSVVALGIPIALMTYSVYLTREKVSRRAMLGVSMAALGAFIVVGVPLFVGQGFASEIHPVATILAFVNVLASPLAVICSRKANDAGLPMSATFGVALMTAFVLTTGVAIVTTGELMPIKAIVQQPMFVMGVLYMALGVSLVARMLTVVTYRRLGSAVTGGMQYVENFLAITLPIVLLNERMTIEMLLGGVLILLGVILTELHHPSQHKDHHWAGYRKVQ